MYIVRHRIFFSLFVSLCLIFLCRFGIESVDAQDSSGSSLTKVVIDPGHGGRDPGAIGGAKTKEKDIVLDISLKVGKMINEKYKDVEVVYTRNKDVFIELDKRGDIANKAHANLFISIHANSVEGKNKRPSGTETFVMGNSKSEANMEVARRENSVILLEEDYTKRYEGFDPTSAESYIYFSLLQNVNQNQSLHFAGEIQKQLSNVNRVDRGVKQGNLLVLWKTAMPSVLVEVGFISNPEEEKYMTSAAGKEKIATAIFNAFCSYKTKIDDRSSFRADERPANMEQEKPVAVSDVQEPVAEPIVEKPKATTVASKKIEFCVQIGSNTKPMDTDPNNFKKYKGVERIQTAPNFFKYIVGRTTEYSKVQETLKKVRVDFKDAFVVSIVDGKILTVAEGLKLINK